MVVAQPPVATATAVCVSVCLCICMRRALSRTQRCVGMCAREPVHEFPRRAAREKHTQQTVLLVGPDCFEGLGYSSSLWSPQLVCSGIRLLCTASFGQWWHRPVAYGIGCCYLRFLLYRMPHSPHLLRSLSVGYDVREPLFRNTFHRGHATLLTYIPGERAQHSHPHMYIPCLGPRKRAWWNGRALADSHRCSIRRV